MAKRVAPDEKPFRPLEESLIRSVIRGVSDSAAVPAALGGGEGTKIPGPPPAVPTGSAPRVLELADEVTQTTEIATRPQPTRPRTTLRTKESPTSALFERMDREKRVLLSRSEEAALDRAVARIGSELGTSLKLSHVLRACVSLLLHAEDELVQRARQSPRLIRPPNGDAPALAAFEKGVAQVLGHGFRDARPLR